MHMHINVRYFFKHIIFALKLSNEFLQLEFPIIYAPISYA